MTKSVDYFPPEDGANQVQGGQEYFDETGRLLDCHHSFIYKHTFKAAKHHNKDLSWMHWADPLDRLCTTAKANGWEIGGSYCRCSTDMQDSYLGQIERCIDRAIQNDIIIFPELIAGDEGKTGKAGDRTGLAMLKTWINTKQVQVIIAFSVSRWFRSLHKGLQFIKEDVVEHGIRAIAIAENVDTDDRQWNDIPWVFT